MKYRLCNRCWLCQSHLTASKDCWLLPVSVRLLDGLALLLHRFSGDRGFPLRLWRLPGWYGHIFYLMPWLPNGLWKFYRFQAVPPDTESGWFLYLSGYGLPDTLKSGLWPFPIHNDLHSVPFLHGQCRYCLWKPSSREDLKESQYTYGLHCSLDCCWEWILTFQSLLQSFPLLPCLLLRSLSAFHTLLHRIPHYLLPILPW